MALCAHFVNSPIRGLWVNSYRRTMGMEISEKLYVGDVVQMRKSHPCGGDTWVVDRVGADIGMVCQTCGRRVLLPRRKFVRGVKRFVKRGKGDIED